MAPSVSRSRIAVNPFISAFNDHCDIVLDDVAPSIDHVRSMDHVGAGSRWCHGLRCSVIQPQHEKKLSDLRDIEEARSS